MVIDVHAHLGDILNTGGGALIFKKGKNMPGSINFPGLFEALSMRTLGTGPLLPLFFESMTRSHLKRVAAATLENMEASMKINNIAYTVCMPIAPYVTFDDLLSAGRNNPTILPFTSIDFTRPADINAVLMNDIDRGAFGLKLHPIIQKTPVSHKTVEAALHFLSEYRLPVLVHAGEFRYYLKKESSRMVPGFGYPGYIASIVHNFPSVRFIIGHAGLFQYDKVIRYMKRSDNVWVDTSFQSPEHIKKLVSAFGENRVMFASDWPYGMAGPSIRTVLKACKNDKKLEELILYKNAADLLGINYE